VGEEELRNMGGKSGDLLFFLLSLPVVCEVEKKTILFSLFLLLERHNPWVSHIVIE
jgi:hypothetical protein